MLLADFETQINFWVNWTVNQKEEDRKYDLCLFKIWIVFEHYLVDMITNYSCGVTSEKGYTPKQKLSFLDESHFNVFFKKNSYVDYISVIENYSEHIFVDNPFQIITTATPYHDYYLQMKTIRNYIAHESSESRAKYISAFFSNDEGKFVEPNDYLMKLNKKHGKTNFNLLIEAVKDMAEYICNPYF